MKILLSIAISFCYSNSILFQGLFAIICKFNIIESHIETLFKVLFLIRVHKRK
jgi:hypothetical protein